MARFPRIQSPCPYKGNLSDIMAGSMCRLCQREVVDLTAMGDDERYALVSGCAEEICVSYRLSAKTVLAAAALGAGFGMSGMAYAQDVASLETPAASAAASDTEAVEPEEMWIIVGGLRAPQQAAWVDTERPEGMAELPVIAGDDDSLPPADPARTADEPASADNPLIESKST